MQERKPIEAQLTAWIESAFKSAFPEGDFSGTRMDVVSAHDNRFGDYQCNSAMGLAKTLSMAPRKIAEEALAHAADLDCVAQTEIAGPGFINITLDQDWLADAMETLAGDDRIGVPEEGQGKTVVIDYSSPNVAKPMHIGHIRSTVIGNALDRLHRFMGYRVIADNHVGDWGTQFGLMLIGYKNFIDEAALEKSPVDELERIYRESYNRSKADPEWLDEARRELVALQKGDETNRALWQKFIDLSKLEFKRTYDRLDVAFDIQRGESYYNDRLAPVVDLLNEKGLTEESEGALVVKLEEEKLPLSIVRKSDGGFNYTTTDIATVISREEDFHPTEIIYVTDERQQLHFKQFFAICGRLGIPTQLRHVWFGLMRLPDATFSTREGNVIKLEVLLDEAERRALEMVKASSPDMDEAIQADVAAAVGIGAIKYADLSQNPQSLVTFTWEKAMSLEGNSAPYLQYAYARIASVRDKYAERFPDGDYESARISIGEPAERRLALHLLRFPSAVREATEQCRPNFMADYLYELAQAYSSFYQNVPFLKAEEGLRESRVKLCGLVAKTLKQGLNLLGIRTPERI